VTNLPRRKRQVPGQIAEAGLMARTPAPVTLLTYPTASGSEVHLRAHTGNPSKYDWHCHGCGVTGPTWLDDPEPASAAADSHARTCQATGDGQ
jgi:hypothetical protein